MYALNVKRGTIVEHPEVKLYGGVAIRVSSQLANQLKHIINVVVFDKVAGVDNIQGKREEKPLYGISKKTLEPVKNGNATNRV